MIRHGPTHDTPAETIQHHCEINERFAHPYISDVGHPKLIDSHRYQMPRQVGPDMPMMPPIRRWRAERLLRHAKQVVFSADARHSLMVYRPAHAPELDRDWPVAVTVAIFTLQQRQALDFIAQRRFFQARPRNQPMPVVSGPTDAGQYAHPFDPNMIALPLHLRLDHRVDAVSPGSPLFRRASLTCRKAARKKSSSSCCWPIFRSSSSIRPPGATDESGSEAAASTASTARSLPLGRPARRSPASPHAANASRQQ